MQRATTLSWASSLINSIRQGPTDINIQKAGICFSLARHFPLSGHLLQHHFLPKWKKQRCFAPEMCFPANSLLSHLSPQWWYLEPSNQHEFSSQHCGPTTWLCALPDQRANVYCRLGTRGDWPEDCKGLHLAWKLLPGGHYYVYIKILILCTL